jgi:hypothetical protein
METKMRKPIPRKRAPKPTPTPVAAATPEPNMAPVSRSFSGLRDVLFDEINALRGPSPDPRRAMAVSSLAKQITNTVVAELNVAKETQALRDKGGDVQVGTLVLGAPASAASAGAPAKVH